LHEQNEPSNSRKRTRSSSGGEERPSKRKFVQNDSALDDTFKNYSVDLTKFEQGVDDIFVALNRGILALKPAILQNLMQKRGIKIHVSLKLNFHLSIDTDYITDPSPVLNTEPVPILESTNLANVLEDIYNSLTSKIEDFSMQGSGWVLHNLLQLQLHVAEFQPLRASAATFKLPKEVLDKKQL
jgi:hypothetical protein